MEQRSSLSPHETFADAVSMVYDAGVDYRTIRAWRCWRRLQILRGLLINAPLECLRCR